MTEGFSVFITTAKLEEIAEKAEELWDLAESCMCGEHPDKKTTTPGEAAADFQALLDNDHPCRSPVICVFQGWLMGAAFALDLATDELVKRSGFTAEGWPILTKLKPLAIRDGCESCEGTGWLHMNIRSANGGEVTDEIVALLNGECTGEIQRCDCGKFATDEEANERHKLDCACGLGLVEPTEHPDEYGTP